MSYTAEHRCQVIRDDYQTDRITFEDCHGQRLEAHSQTTLHLVDPYSGRAIDGYSLQPKTHKLLHRAVEARPDYHEDRRKAVFLCTAEAINWANLGQAISLYEQIKSDPRNVRNPIRMSDKLNSLWNYIAHLYDKPYNTYEEAVDMGIEYTRQMQYAEV